jgi:hypothetical protein
MPAIIYDFKGLGGALRKQRLIGGNPRILRRSGGLPGRGSNRMRFGGVALSDLVDRVVEATRGTELECGPWHLDYRPRASLRHNRICARPRSGILRGSSASYGADYRSRRPPAFRHDLIAPDQLDLAATRIRTIGAADGAVQHEKSRRGARSSDSRSGGAILELSEPAVAPPINSHAPR